MSIFGRTPARPTAHQQETVVVVSFRSLGERVFLDDFNPEHGYAYIWPFTEPPLLGQWAIAEGTDGPTTVVVRALGVPAHARRLQLKALLRLISQSEVDKAQAAREAPLRAWLDMARQAAGLPTVKPVSANLPPGFDELPPVEGDADAASAAHFGDVWWRAFKHAQELGRDPEEVATFERIGRGWFRVRDRTTREEQLATVTRVAESIDLNAAIRNVDNRSPAEVESMMFAARPLWDWLKYVEELGRQGCDDEALELVGALITAAEQEAQASGHEPAPAYTERAAIIYRRRKDYAAEIGVIERWERACLPEKLGHGATQDKLAKRLTRARELAVKQRYISK